MDKVATHTQEDISKATEAAFVTPYKEQPAPQDPPAQQAQPAAAAPQDPPAQQPAPQDPPVQQAQAATVNYEDISDEELNKILAKRTKGAVKSLEDFTPKVVKTKEELAEEEERQNTAAITWALTSGKVKREDYDTAIREKDKSNRDLALTLFTAELKSEDSKITPEEAEEMFKEYFMEDAEEGNTQRKLRLKEMNKTADAYRKEKYGFIDNISPDYKQHLTTEENKKLIGQKMADVFDTFAPEIELKSTYTPAGAADGETSELSFAYKIDDAELKSIKKDTKERLVNMLTKLSVDPATITDESIKEEFNSVVRARYFDKIVAHAVTESANKAKLDTEAYYKNIPVRTPNFASGQQPGKSTSKIREFSAAEKEAFPKTQYTA